MRTMYGRSAVLLALLVGVHVAAQNAPGGTRMLLIPRPVEGTLDFVDPGSGLRLASVPLDTGPRRVAVAPDGRQAAVLGCGRAKSNEDSPLSMSLIDLEHPRETRRIDLGHGLCPRTLTWTGANPTTSDAPERAVAEADASTVAVQQFLSAGGELSDIAIARVVPRAVCHACTPDP